MKQPLFALRRKYTRYAFLLTGVVIFCVVANTRVINYITQNHISKDIASTPSHTIGLIFGTSRTNNRGTTNLFFLYRIQQAVSLYKAWKIQYLLVSGDNREKYYDEPHDFKEELVKRGIPTERIVLDYGWLSTWDSIARAKTLFAVPDLLLISQSFQIQRGLIACRYRDIACDGSAARDISFRIAPRVYLREYGAKLKLRYDMLTPAPEIGWTPEVTPRST